MRHSIIALFQYRFKYAVPEAKSPPRKIIWAVEAETHASEGQSPAFRRKLSGSALGLFAGDFDRFHGLASNTRLKGVSVARRKRVNPPAVTTSRNLASPACAPRARPTSCDNEAGVHNRVEAE